MSERKFFTRRNFLIGSGLVGFGALGSLMFEEPAEPKVHYKITKDIPRETMVLTYNSCYVPKIKEISKGLETSLKVLRDRSKILENYVRYIEGVEDYCDSLPEKLDSEQKQELSKYIKSGEDLELRLTSMSSSFIGEDIELDIYNSREAEQRFKDSVFFNKVEDDSEKRDKDLIKHSGELFREMTGEYPQSVSCSIEELLDYDCEGYYEFLNKKIVVKRASYPKTLLVLMHESGHTTSPHDRQEIIKRHNAEDVNFIIGEEAYAYAFQIASSYYEKNKELSDLMKILMLMYVEDHVQGFFEGGERHDNKNLLIADSAVTIADATIIYFQNPKQAYNYLATTPYDKIKPEIWGIIEENKAIYLEKKNLVDEVNKSTSEVNKELERVRKKFEVVLKGSRRRVGG